MSEDRKKVLLVDDTAFFRTMLGSELKDAGFDVTFAANGIEALEKIKEMRGVIDILVLDLYMPEMDGFGVMAKIKGSVVEGKFPILVITGEYEASDVLKRVRDLGAKGFLSKSSAAEQVVERVKALVGV